ncbi:MAG: hypothetical protein LQ352_004290 [Teloschistes flavicans]|nr:MAG: hypothetical protein LQ352_004290 [Teloschistes flavicans]
MASTTMFLRNRLLPALVTALVVAVYLVANHVEHQHSSRRFVSGLVSRQPSSVKTSVKGEAKVRANLSASDTRNVALTFGHDDDVFHFSPIITRSLSKRALDPKYDCLVEKGRRYYEDGILPAFNGHSAFATPTFDESSFQANGWSRIDEDNEVVPQAWKPALAMVPEGRPASGDESDRDEEVTLVYMDQNEPFTNAEGQETPPSNAYYWANYLPETFAILISTTYSPSYQLQQAGVPADQIPSRTPPLHRLSDVLWAVWESFVYAPGNFRYYAVDGITNAIARPLMEDIFNDRRGTTVVPWENRLTFGLDSKEGKALLASPNGLAVAWILIHRAEELGRREPRVTIFNPDGTNRCMIWDLIPQGGEGVFGDPLHD